MTLSDGLKRDIKILKKNLQDESELKKVLKLRLTKKQYKVFLSINANEDDKLIKEKLLLNDNRLKEIKDILVKKLNYEKLKNELTKG
jgi:hypothetical protein